MPNPRNIYKKEERLKLQTFMYIIFNTSLHEADYVSFTFCHTIK